MNPRQNSCHNPGRSAARRLPARIAAKAATWTLDAAAIICALAVISVLVALIATAPLRADEPGLPALNSSAPEADHEWKFRVFVDDKEVGYHHFFLLQQNGQRVLRSIADFEYKLVFLTLYQYEHRNIEVWEGDCLAHIESKTDANGKDFAVDGEKQGDAFVVQGNKGTQKLPPCVMSFAYWNPEFLEAQRLLNTQDGEYLEVTVSEPERDQLDIGGTATPAWRYRLQAGELDLKLWYSHEYEWLGLETRYKNGRTLRYDLQTEPQVPADLVALR